MKSLPDDTHNNRIDPVSGWITTDQSGPDEAVVAADLYFFGFGHQYTSALKAFTGIAGPAPMPPRFTLGVWWSRYWPYTSEDLEDIARGYEQHAIPLDVLVSDMAWHCESLSFLLFSSVPIPAEHSTCPACCLPSDPCPTLH